MIMLKFSDYCSPKTNEIFERYKFNSIYQKEGQAFDSFLTDLRKAVKTTGYKEQNEMIRDRIVMGIHDKTTQERLLRESKLTLTKAIEFCRTVEVSKQQSKTLQEGGADVHLDAVKHKKPNMCKYCGYKHDFKKKCPAFGKTCASCQGRNHFASVCKSRTKNHNNKGDEGSSRKKKVDELQKQNDEPDKDGTDADSSEFYVDSVKSIGAVGANVREQTVWKKKLIVEDKEIEFKLDTGAEVSILPAYAVKSCNLSRIKPTDVTLVAYGSEKFKIKPVGEISLTCRCNGRNAIINFIVVDCKNQVPLLGLTGCIALKLIKRIDNLVKNIVHGSKTIFRSLEDIKLMYPQVFEGLGRFPNEYHISLKEDAVPHISAIRRVPQTLREKLKTKLDQMCELGVIRKVDKPTAFLHPLVIVEKPNGDLRLCLDPKSLNESIKREHFLIPSLEEIT
ncbi:uncharacterized protein LOC123306952 [Coccinella septempunctata]|uniref:uncharacterized protein LOC123306952 n=1 Tax=Coccinella septempunctata TaxID=41139 RepID=UPI001D0697AB|nr:uncharacterized protein LOC123306952 [Coccinella septempunctata]